MKDVEIALIILTQNKYFGELDLIINRLNELEINKYFQCYVACKNINRKFNFSNWIKLDIPENCKTWGSELIYVLDILKEKYVFIFLDDFYPYKKISALKLKEKIVSSLEYNPSIIRINSNHNRRIFLKRKENNIFLETYKNRYSTSLVLPIFEKIFLKQILSKNDSPWSFDRYAKERFNFNDHNFVFIKGNKIDFHLANLVIKGYSLRSSLYRIPKYKKHNYEKLSKIKKMSLLEEIKFHLKKILADILTTYFPSNRYFK